MIGLFGYSTESDYSQEYRSVSNRKQISLSIFGLTLNEFFCSMISPNFKIGSSSMLFLIFVLEIDYMMET